MHLRHPRPAVIVAAWTLLVWVGRIRNIWADEDLSSAEQRWRTALAVVMGVGAVGILAAVRKGGSTTIAAVRGFAVLTTLVWGVRGTQILLGDWEAGFKVVHSVLAVGSIALVWWADRTAQKTSAAVEPATVS